LIFFSWSYFSTVAVLTGMTARTWGILQYFPNIDDVDDDDVQ